MFTLSVKAVWCRTEELGFGLSFHLLIKYSMRVYDVSGTGLDLRQTDMLTSFFSSVTLGNLLKPSSVKPGHCNS